MPVHNKPRSSSGRLSQHHRTGSGGSSKVNLALTQKDPTPQPKQQQNLKKTSHSTAELHQARQYPRVSHLSTNSRVRSKDQIVAAQRRAHSIGKQQHVQEEHQQLPARRLPQRPNFSIAHSDETTDSDDEWVSSESGAATPQIQTNLDAQDQKDQRDLDGHGTVTLDSPVDQQGEVKMNGNGVYIYGNADRATLTAISPIEGGATTPRAEVDLGQDLTRVETARLKIDTSAGAAVAGISSRAQQDREEMKRETEPPPVVRVQVQSTPATPVPPTPPTVVEQPTPNAKDLAVRHVQSEAPSPTQLRQRPSASRRTTLIRHSSTHGDVKKDMPPHPLIRGPSFHGGAALRHARLAPLTVVNSEFAQAQLTASPSGAVTPSRAGSPSFNKSPSDASTETQERFPSRKGSISSLHSIATLPARGKPSHPQSQYPYQNPHRTRTLSTLSTSSSSAALAALSTLPSVSTSRPTSPPMVVCFPAETRRDRERERERDWERDWTQDAIHPLLPPPYLATHTTVIAKYNPLADCWERVMRAKHGR